MLLLDVAMIFSMNDVGSSRLSFGNAGVNDIFDPAVWF